MPTVEDEWPDEYADDVVLGQCEQCRIDDVLVRYINDPYLRELEPGAENPETYWCYPCYRQRAYDI